MSIVLAEQLKHVTASRKQKYRPARFRDFVPVDNSVPTWATHVEHSQITDSSEDPVRVGTGSVKNIPRPTLNKAASEIAVIEFAMAYGYTDSEMERADHLGINLSSQLPVHNQGRWERFLDAVCAGQRTTALGLPGLLNVPGITPITAASTWATATFAQIVDEVGIAAQAVHERTLENLEADLVILPVASYWALTRSLHATSTESALSLLKRMFPRIRFVSWNRSSLADAAGTGPRMTTMATGEDVARLIVPRELTDKRPIEVPLGIEVPQLGSTCGVLVETATAIVYTDGI